MTITSVRLLDLPRHRFLMHFVPTPSSLEFAEKSFSSLVANKLDFIIKQAKPDQVKDALVEINDAVGLIRDLGAEIVKDSRLLDERKIDELVRVILPFAGRGRLEEGIRDILREALNTHKIPNQL